MINDHLEHPKHSSPSKLTRFNHVLTNKVNFYLLGITCIIFGVALLLLENNAGYGFAYVGIAINCLGTISSMGYSMLKVREVTGGNKDIEKKIKKSELPVIP